MIRTNQKRDLVLISSTYPYGSFETFLENEIPELNNYFNVIVVPSSATYQPAKRTLPDEVSLLEWEKFAKPYRAFQSSVANSSLFFSILSREIGANPRKREFILANSREWLQRVNFASHRADSILKGLEQFSLQKPIFYSYWLDDSALIAALLKGEFPGSYAISRTHGYDLYDERRKGGYQPFRDWLMTVLDGVFTASETGRDYLTENTRLGHKVHYIPLGTSDYGMAPVPPTNEKPVIVSVANVVSLKQIGLLARALASTEMELEWHHFGDGPEMDRIKTIVQSASPRLTARFHGWVANEQLMEFYSATPVHCVVSVSSSEGGVPVNLQEGASFGIPLIATDAGGSYELVNDITGTRLSSYPDEKDVIGAIEQVVSSYSTNKKRRERIREFWRTHFNAKNNFMEFARKVGELIPNTR